MAIKGVSNICSHSHFFHPLCPQLSLTTKVANIFFLALAVVLSATVYYALTKTAPPDKPTQPLGGTQIPQFPSVSRLRAFLTASKISSIDKINQIATIVGVSIDVIERRAKPTGETTRGFIPEGGSLLETIRKNWAQVKQANTTHADIAKHLQYLIDTARKNPKKVICYDPVTGSTNPEEDNIPRFQVQIRKVENPDTDIFRPMDAALDEGASYEEVVILNTALQGKYIRWTPVRHRYICEFGFYSTGMDLATVLNVLLKKSNHFSS